MSGITRKGDKMDVWGALWPTVPKAHLSVIKAVLGRIAIDATYETIIRMVELNAPKADIEDQIATARAVRDILAHQRLELTIGMPLPI